jgi:hypothetical protein
MPLNKPAAVLRVLVQLSLLICAHPMAASELSVFDNIYKTNKWGGTNISNAGAGSGGGSSLQGSIGASRIIYHVCVERNLNSIVDAPCGGMEWQESLALQLRRILPHFRYLGLDAAASVIERNQQHFQANSHVAFCKADLTSLTLSLPPQYDGLLLSRDSMMHNTLDGCWKMLNFFTRTHVKYVLLGSYGKNHPGRKNGARSTGRWFAIALDEPPFNLKPLRKYPEGDGENKFMLLYEREQLRAELVKRGMARDGWVQNSTGSSERPRSCAYPSNGRTPIPCGNDRHCR